MNACGGALVGGEALFGDEYSAPRSDRFITGEMAPIIY